MLDYSVLEKAYTYFKENQYPVATRYDRIYHEIEAKQRELDELRNSIESIEQMMVDTYNEIFPPK